MKRDFSGASAREYVAELASNGRYHFSSADARAALGVSAAAARLALNRLEKKKAIASPARGFYVIVPPEYRAIGCLPADQFVPALMARRGLPYYAGLLSAAQYYGAAHHRPQEFQVCVGKSRRPIRCGAVRVGFIVRKRIREVPLRSFNTPRGTIVVSTPEATAFDLVGYPERSGGLDQVATVLSELADKLDPQELVVAARTAPLPWAQRLGYLLERTADDAETKTPPLKAYVREHARQTTSLWPAGSADSTQRDRDWKLYVNVEVEVESM